MRKRTARRPVSDSQVTRSSPFPPPQLVVPPEAMWAPDPFGRFQLRYWDGQQWTAHVSSWWRQEIDPDFSVDE